MEALVAPAALPASGPKAHLDAGVAGRALKGTVPAGHNAGATKGLYALLMARAAGHANDELFARMLASQTAANSALPPGLGLVPAEFRALMARHYPGFGLPTMLAQAPNLGDRMPEWDELHTLLLEYRADADLSETWMATIVATACMGGDHLWQDLGLWSRADLTLLMGRNFPGLTARNDRDMKWKKFLYKQLCERTGVYVCRSPSCEVCVDYVKCFASE
jgi:nitrogen fixation protein NifQ